MVVERLKKRRDFLRVGKSGKKFVSAAFVLQWGPGEDGLARVGFTASKKVGNAVMRNRAKRRMRAVVVACDDCFKPGVDYVLIARSAVLEREFLQMVGEFKKGLLEVDKQSLTTDDHHPRA